MFQKLKDFWAGVKAWFKNSETIFLNRVEVFIGFLVIAFSAMDWSPLLSAGVSTGFTWIQAATLGSIMAVKGIVGELARRINTKEVAGRLLPTEILTPKIEKEIKKEVKVKEEKEETK